MSEPAPSPGAPGARRGRLARALALGAVLGAGAIVVVLGTSWREVAGRYWLFRAGRAEDPTAAIRAAARLLGQGDPRLRALFRLEPGEVRVTFARAAPGPGRSQYAVECTVENVSSRRLVLAPALSAAFYLNEPAIGGGTKAWPEWTRPPGAVALAPGETFAISASGAAFASLVAQSVAEHHRGRIDCEAELLRNEDGFLLHDGGEIDREFARLAADVSRGVEAPGLGRTIGYGTVRFGADVEAGERP